MREASAARRAGSDQKPLRGDPVNSDKQEHIAGVALDALAESIKESAVTIDVNY